ncbi:MAG: hypothetical protein IJ092_00845 [Atopobiaceae bacterium]|nr:hypothetical protein [Atopobiaceae bacterium]
MLRIYRAPDGRTYQYEEGEQPDGYEPTDAPKSKRRTAQNKRRTAQDKSKE